MTGIKKFNTKLFFVGQAALFLVITLVLVVSNASYAAVPGNNELTSLNYQGNPVSGANWLGSSADGKFVAFSSSRNDVVSTTYTSPIYDQLYLRDIENTSTILVSKTSTGTNSDQAVVWSMVSENGKYVIYGSRATNIVSGVTLTGVIQIYLYDRTADTNTLVSQTTSGTTSNENLFPVGVSNDGRFVFFSGEATNLGPTMTSQGAGMAYYKQVFVKDMQQGTISIATLNNSAVNQNGYNLATTDDYGHSVSCDGSFLVFTTPASNMHSSNTNGKAQVYIADFRKGYKVTAITVGANEHTSYPTISCNGNYVTFKSKATNLVSGVTSNAYDHGYVYNRLTGQTVLIDKNTSGSPSSLGVYSGALTTSNEGVTAYISNSSGIVSTNINSKAQVFLHNMSSNTTELASIDSSGNPAANGVSVLPVVSANGKTVTYFSNSSSLVTQNVVGVVRSQTGN